MRKEALYALGAFALFVALLGGAVWLANAPMKPTTQQIHAAIPDERIPR